MKLNQAVIAVVVASSVGISAVHAQVSSAPVPDTVGKIDMVYVEVARGLLIDKKLVRERHQEGLVAVADVLMPRHSAEPQLMVRLMPRSKVETGDLVTVQQAQPDWRMSAVSRTDPLPYELAPIAEFKAAKDTLEAMMFVRHPLAMRAP